MERPAAWKTPICLPDSVSYSHALDPIPTTRLPSALAPRQETLLEETRSSSRMRCPSRRWRRYSTSAQLAVRAERHAPDHGRVALEGADFLARLGVPEPCRFVVASAKHALAVWAERHACDESGMTLERADFLAGLGVHIVAGVATTRAPGDVGRAGSRAGGAATPLTRKIRLPSGLHAATGQGNSRIFLPDSASHSRAVESVRLSTRWPSALKATEARPLKSGSYARIA